MAQQECTGTVQVTTSLQATATLSAYIWCNTISVQTYLDTESTIALGDNYDLASAKRLENDVVYEIIEYLSSVYTISISSVANILTAVASKLTAARIAMGRMDASIGMDPANWTIRLSNEAWATLIRIFVNQTLSGSNITTLSVPLWKRLMLAKSRERSVVPNA